MKPKSHFRHIPASRRLQVLALAAAASSFAPSAWAASATWTDATSGGEWNTSANWTTGGPPAGGNATFNSAIGGAGLVNNAVGGQNVTSVIFDTNASSITIGASTSAKALNASTNGALAIASTILGTGLTETVNTPMDLGIGTYTFSNSATDPTDILVVNGAITAVGTTTTAETLNLTGTNTGANTINGAISDGSATSGLSIVKKNGGTWVLTGANTFTGGIILEGGTLSVGNIGTLGSAGNLGNVSVINIGITTVASTLLYTGNGETTNRGINLAGTTGGATIDESGASGTLTFNGTFTATGAGIKTLTLQGSSGGVGNVATAIVDNSTTNKTSLLKAGTGTWMLAGANTYTGSTTVTGGTLMLASATALASATGAVTVNAGATLNSNVASTTLGGSLTLSGGTLAATAGSFALASGKNLILSSGTIALTLAGASSYNSISSAGLATFSLTGGTIDLTNSVTNYAASYQILSGFTGGTVSGISIIDYDTTDYVANLAGNGVLTFSAVPEPKTWILLGLCAIFFSFRRLRGKRA